MSSLAGVGSIMAEMHSLEYYYGVAHDARNHVIRLKSLVASSVMAHCSYVKSWIYLSILVAVVILSFL